MHYCISLLVYFLFPFLEHKLYEIRDLSVLFASVSPAPGTGLNINQMPYVVLNSGFYGPSTVDFPHNIFLIQAVSYLEFVFQKGVYKVLLKIRI